MKQLHTFTLASGTFVNIFKSVFSNGQQQVQYGFGITRVEWVTANFATVFLGFYQVEAEQRYRFAKQLREYLGRDETRNNVQLFCFTKNFTGQLAHYNKSKSKIVW